MYDTELTLVQIVAARDAARRYPRGFGRKWGYKFVQDGPVGAWGDPEDVVVGFG